MFNFKKPYIFKIVSTTMAVVFLLNNAVYGIGLSEKTSLRLPLKMAENAGDVKNAMKTVASGKISPGLKISFLALLGFMLSPIQFTEASPSYHMPFNFATYTSPEWLAERFPPTREKTYTKTETALAGMITKILSDLEYPDFTHNELTPVIMKFFEDIKFDKLYKEATSVRNSNKIGRHKAFVKKIMKLVREKRFGDYEDILKYNGYSEDSPSMPSDLYGDAYDTNKMEYLQESLIGAIRGKKLPDSSEAKSIKKCIGTSDVFIITLRSLGFNIEGAEMAGHAFAVMPSFIEDKYVIADVGMDRFFVFDKKEKFNESLTGFMLLKGLDEKNLKQRLANRDQLLGKDLEDFRAEVTKWSDKKAFSMIYFYFRVMPCGMTSSIYCSLGEFYDGKDPEEAKQLFLKAIEIDPNNARAYYGLAKFYKNKEQDYEEEKKLLNKVIAIDPYYALAWLRLARIYYAEGDIVTAMELCNKAVDFKLVSAYQFRGLLLTEMNEDLEAIEMYKIAISAQPTIKRARDWEPFLSAYRELAELYEKNGRAEDAEATYDEMAKIHPNQLYIISSNGSYYEKLGQYKKAIRFYKEALEKGAMDQSVYKGIVNSYEKIMEAGDQSAKVRLDYADICCEFGTAYAKEGAHNEAIELYNKAISKDEGYVKAYSFLGKSCLIRKRYDEAIYSYMEAIKRGKNDVATYSYLAESYRGKGDYENALNTYNEILKKYPASLYSKYNIATMDVELGDYENATRLYEELIESGPSYCMLAYCGLAKIYTKTGDYKKAIEKGEKARKANPYTVEPYFELANVYMNIGDIDAAIENYTSAFDIDSKLVNQIPKDFKNRLPRDFIKKYFSDTGTDPDVIIGGTLYIPPEVIRFYNIIEEMKNLNFCL
ncbi:MAG: tetratricopeptide repeat protein [Candidatus Omnitrophica bacterium]|nr:tetratricopeptide repeat protein [Candidatus Omnitrophota bacterium]